MGMLRTSGTFCSTKIIKDNQDKHLKAYRPPEKEHGEIGVTTANIGDSVCAL